MSNRESSTIPRWADRLRDLSYRARCRMRWSAPVWKRSIRPFEAILDAAPGVARDRVVDLSRRYPVAAWTGVVNRFEARENLYLLDVLDRFVAIGPDKTRRGLDVGSKNGSSLPALAAFSRCPWDLVEIDAHRRYWDFTTRRAHGEWMARRFAGSRFVAGSVVDLFGKYDLVTWVLPFVRPGPLESWGLPRRLFAPEELLRHVIGRVAPGGTLLVINQGDVERETQAHLFAKIGVSAEDLGRVESALSPFIRPRFAFRWFCPTTDDSKAAEVGPG